MLKKYAFGLAFIIIINGAQSSTVDIQILETSDIHSNLTDYDFYKKEVTERFGFVRTATLIRQMKENNINTVLVDNGDLIQGSPMADWAVKVVSENKVTHPAIKSLNAMEYTIGNLGNHEFNYGLDYLQEVLSKAKYPYVNANIYDATTNQPYFTPYQIIETAVINRDGKQESIKVGYIGFVPPQILEWDKNHLQGKVLSKDIVETANHFIPEMKAKGADLIVVIAHSGLSIDPYKLMAENSVYYLSEVKDVDAILFGHAHALFPGKDFENIKGIDIEKGLINGVPAVMPGMWGSHLGVVDITLEKQKDQWNVINSSAKLLPIFDSTQNKALVQSDSHLNELLKDDLSATKEYMSKVVGKTNNDLYSALALVQDDPTIQIVNDYQKKYIEHHIQGDPDLADIPVLSAVAPFKAGGRKNDPTAYIEIPKGELTVTSIADLYLYENTLAAVKVTGKELNEWLECSAGLYNQIDINNKEPQYLINWDNFRLYNYDIIDGGLSYQIDVTVPARYSPNCELMNDNSKRIKNLTYQGQPITDEQPFIIATNNYRALTGSFPGTGEDHLVINSPDPVREIMLNGIVADTEKNGSVTVEVDQNWSLLPIQSDVPLDIRFETSPTEKAEEYIKNNASYPIKRIGTDEIGYGIYQIDLQRK